MNVDTSRTDGESHGEINRRPEPPSSERIAGAREILLARLKAGDPGTIESFVREQSRRLLATSRRLLAREDDSRAVVTQAFAAAFQTLGRFERLAALEASLHRTTLHAALAKLRTARGEEERPIQDLLPRFDAGGGYASPVVPWRTTAEEAARRPATREFLRACVACLPTAFRVVYVLQDIEGLSAGETARLLDLSSSEVRRRLHDARQALRSLLTPVLAEEAHE